jgi:hypothetical protein
MEQLILLVLGCVVIAQMVEMTVHVWRHDRRVDRLLRLGREQLAKLRNNTLLLVLVCCSACAATQPAVRTARVERVEARIAREARLIELAKLHPNAKPRERTACPEHVPSGAVLNCLSVTPPSKPWL